MNKHQVFVSLLLFFVLASSVFGKKPTVVKSKHGDAIQGISPDCPIIYDNDWWKDVPDASYLWAKASLGEADLRGNIVSRDMWEWKSGYKFSMKTVPVGSPIAL